jgi:hypothetical protein
MNISGKYLKVWKVEVKEKVVLVNLGDSKKNKDGTWDNWTWFNVAFVGQAKDPATTLNEGDLIEIISGQLTQAKDKNDPKKFYNNMVVFEFDFMQRSEPKQDDFGGEEEEGDLPY